jgi:hypothetical protein
MSEQSPVVWVVGGHPLSFDAVFRSYGSPVLVTSWTLSANPQAVIDKLIHSKPTDFLGVVLADTNLGIAVAVWLMLHKTCQLIVHKDDGPELYVLDKHNLLKEVELARARYDKSKPTK